jgi:UDP-N-acetylglucosamine acyltransferase
MLIAGDAGEINRFSPQQRLFFLPSYHPPFTQASPDFFIRANSSDTFKMTIHKTADIDSSAILGDNVAIGPFSIVGPDVKIGDNTEVASHVVIYPGTVIGRDCKIHHGASIGDEPQMVGFEDTASSVEIGEGTVIREYVTIHRGAKESQATKIGKHCMLMNYVHIAHDCEIGDRVIIVNYTGLSGHVVVEDNAFVSGQVGVHQFVRIGKNAMVGGKAAVSKDILPYSLVEGTPARLVSVNTIGLRRSNIQPKTRTALKSAFKLLQDPAHNTAQAIEKMEAEFEMRDEIRYLIHFINHSSRGITK